MIHIGNQSEWTTADDDLPLLSKLRLSNGKCMAHHHAAAAVLDWLEVMMMSSEGFACQEV